jgi:hypothetical protein
MSLEHSVSESVVFIHLGAIVWARRVPCISSHEMHLLYEAAWMAFTSRMLRIMKPFGKHQRLFRLLSRGQNLIG